MSNSLTLKPNALAEYQEWLITVKKRILTPSGASEAFGQQPVDQIQGVVAAMATMVNNDQDFKTGE